MKTTPIWIAPLVLVIAVAGYLGLHRFVGRADDRAAIAAATSSARCNPGAASAAAAPASLEAWAEGAPKLERLGDYRRAVTTSSEDSRRYFDQGLRLIYAFNHDEAVRAFAEALRLDPSCALCAWGAGEALGPNYNMPVMPDRWKALWQAVQRAQALAPNAAPVEQALIAALAKRYSGPEPLDPAAMAPLNRAYSDAMREVAVRFPDDDDVQVFFAEALMTSNPWKLWSLDGQPSPGTGEIVATLEKVLARNPAHPGANHYYIHAVEASTQPERALASAGRLPGLMPGAGHIVHMPAHILQRVGRYAEASAANASGADADLAYLQQGRPPAYSYYGMYLAHNYQFLAYSAAMEGRSAAAIEAAAKMRAVIPKEVLLSAPGLDWYVSEIYSTALRFGRWDALLAEPPPDPALPMLSAGWHYARAFAFVAKRRLAEAETERRALDQAAASIADDAPAGLNRAKDVLAVATRVIAARLAAAQGEQSKAVLLLREAAALEDRLAYDEPADWFVPVRHLLGAELLARGAAGEAEAVYREDLLRHPENGWALHGLAQALRAAGKADEADAVQERFDRAWRRADVPLQASAF
ncbi:MAG: hypothetical protein NVS9B10_11990 [Nevskia sp.]